MMGTELNTWLMLQNAATHFGDVEIVSAMDEGTHRLSFADFVRRTHRLMHALDALGIEEGARVATLAWNHHRHLECYFAVPCAARVLHTLNARLSPEELGQIVRHADDRAIFVDPDLLPLLERCGDALARVEHVVVLGREVPPTSLLNVVAYEDLLARAPSTPYPERAIPEETPSGLCYTSGTTGGPKGVLYTHRSTFLHALAITSMGAMAFGPQDAVMPVVPMFHASAWGIPYAAVLVGAKLVFAGRRVDAPRLVDLVNEEQVTVAAGVPTIWLGFAEELVRRGARPASLRHLVCGGAQPPSSLIERLRTEHDLPLVQVWGMTETSPLASVAWPKAHMRGWPEEKLARAVRAQAGLPLPGVAVSIRDESGNEAPHDGESMGALLVRGPWVTDRYYGSDDRSQFTDDGWFRTGDVAIGSPDGYFVIADRTKDLIKSGGEWISSVDMEGALMALPCVAEAAVIAIPDAKWQERPLACVTVRDGARLDEQEARAHLEKSGFARWQLPDRFEIVSAIPRTSVGKFDKKALRARFAEAT